MVERTIRDMLRDTDSIRDRVAERIYGGNAPQGTYGECIIIRDVSGTHNYSLSGEIGTRQSVVQIDCYSDSSARAYDLCEMVRNRLSGRPGGDEIESCIIVGGARAADEAPSDKSDRWVHSYSLDFEVFHYEGIPTND